MKHSKYSILTMILALVLALSLVACGAEPTDNTTETTVKVCAQHQWEEANCTTPKTCLTCGTTEGDRLESAHAYAASGEWYACVFCGTQAPNDTKACTHVTGKDTCPICGKTALNVIKNVIYVIGDGMGLEHIAAGEIAFNKEYRFEDWQFASVNTDSLTSGGRNQSELTDSAAAGTALATGTVTLNGYVGKDQNGNDLTTVLDYARSYGKRTGLITTDYLYGATPGAFSAHCKDRNQHDEILASQILSGIDLLCGAESDTNYLDGDTIASNGYEHCESLLDMKENLSAKKLYCTLQMSACKSQNYPESLSEATSVALDYLDCDKGFVLVIEQAHIDKASHNKNCEDMVRAVDELNNTVEAIFAWMGERTDTAIVITADHETGDFSVSRSKTLPYSAKIGETTFYYRFNSGSHTKSNVGLFIYGADVDIEKHSYFKTPYVVKNSDVYTIVYRLMRDLR